jgi:hypothetical protein
MSIIQCPVLGYRMISEWRIGRNVEQNAHGLIWGIIREFSWGKTHSGWSVPRARFEPITSQIEVISLESSCSIKVCYHGSCLRFTLHSTVVTHVPSASALEYWMVPNSGSVKFVWSSGKVTYPFLLTHYGVDLLQKPPIMQPLKNFPTFYGTRKFITVLTRAFHWSLSWARSIQSISSHLISLYVCIRGGP